MKFARAYALPILLALTCPVYAASSWQGQFLISNVTQACIDANSDVAGDFGTMVFRPIINSGDPAEALSIIGGHSASLYSSSAPNGSLSGPVKYSGIRINSGAFADQFVGTSNLQIVPRPITASSPFVAVSGTINNWFNHSGCTVTLKAYLQPH